MTEKRFRNNGSMIFDNEKPMNTIEVVDVLNAQHEENKQLKQEIKELQSQNNDVEWLRNNTVWEQLPTNRKTLTKTTYER